MTGIRVVLGDDHVLVRTGIKALLVAAGIDIIGEAGNGRELLREIRRLRPDIAIVDISMPLLDGLEVAQRTTTLSPETRVVMLSMFDDEEYVELARAAGAWGYVTKDTAADRLIDVIRRVAAGDPCLPERVGRRVDDPLTPREREVLQLIVEGKKNTEIAQIMSRSVYTVRSHRARLMRKLDARTGAQLVQVAAARGLLRIPLPQAGA